MRITIHGIPPRRQKTMALTDEAATRKDRTTGKSEMQHRHFATIAAILSNMNADRETCERWADELAPTNYKFDRRRFLRACGHD